MASVNIFTGTGRLVRDIEIKQIRPGLTAGKFTLAMEYIKKGKEGEEKEVCFIDCTIWNDEALKAADLKKGAEVFVKGRLRLEKWPDKTTGMERSKHTVVVDTIMHNFKMDPYVQDNQPTLDEPAQMPKQASRPAPKPMINEFEDELPF